MTDYERINAPRVEAIGKILDLIDKSARSQRVHGALEHAALLKPVLDRLTAIGVDDVRPAILPQPEADERTNAVQTPRSQTLRSDMALRATLEQAPMEDLSMAMAVIMSRVDDLIHRQRGK